MHHCSTQILPSIISDESPKRSLGSDQPGIAEILDEDLVDEGVLRQCLNHAGPLITKHLQILWDI